MVLTDAQVNTAKGPWPFLDLLDEQEAAAAPHAAFLQPKTAVDQSKTALSSGANTALPAAAVRAAASATGNMPLDAVRRAVRSVAADIAGDDMFEGVLWTVHSCLAWERHILQVSTSNMILYSTIATSH